MERCTHFLIILKIAVASGGGIIAAADRSGHIYALKLER